MIQGFGQEITEIPAFGHDITEVRAMGELAWQKQSSIPDYLCFTALEAGQFTLTIPAAVTSANLTYVEYSLDGRNWTRLTVDNTAQSITTPTIQAGGKVYWRGSGNATAMGATVGTQNSQFSSSARFDVSGNIMSMLFADDFDEQLVLPNVRYSFTALFRNCSKLISAENLLLPAMTLRAECYRNLFLSCSHLVNGVKVLPAMQLISNCYLQMYANCSSLTEGTEIHATTAEPLCCYAMYTGCSSLTAPKPIFFTNTAPSCCYQMYRNCTSLEVAPELTPATLANNCCRQMFKGCTKLKYIKCLATDISATNCLQDWTDGVAANGTFIQASGVTWPRGASGIPTGWVNVEKRTMPSGYKQLLQVTSNGTAYIQLSFGFEETDEVAATFSVDTSQTTDKYIVCPQTWNNNSNRYGMGVHNYGQYTAAFGNLSTGNTILTPRTYNNGELHNWTYAAATFAVTDKSCSINITGYTFGGITTNLRLFYGYNSNTKGAISSYKHIKGSTTACDFVAAIRESDDTAGLYDLAKNEFVTCNGLTAGEEI